MKKRTKKKIVYILAFLLLIFSIYLLTLLLGEKIKPIIKNPLAVREFVLKFKILSPIVFILLVALQVIFAPIPGQVIGIASGYIFGTVFGTLFCILGLLLGSFLAFLLSRKFGRPFVEKIISKEKISKLDNKVLKYGLFPLFLVYLLPTFPDDLICFLAGLSKIKTKDFLFISTIGRLPGFLVLNLIGAGLLSPQNQKISILIFVLVSIFSFLVYLNKNKIEKLIFRI